MTRLGVIAAALTAATAAAEEARISLDEWTSMTEGATVFYEVDGADAGREYYFPGGGFAVFQRPDGGCVEGPWAWDGARFCFWYEGELQCFSHLRRDGELFSRPDTGGREQHVARIVEGAALTCAPL